MLGWVSFGLGLVWGGSRRGWVFRSWEGALRRLLVSTVLFKALSPG